MKLAESDVNKFYVGSTEVDKVYLGSTQVYPWTPALLGADLALWLDAADTDTITLNGSDVSQWDDKSGNGNHASQATAAEQPTYQATGLNSKPTVSFDATKILEFGSTLFTNPSQLYGSAVLKGNTINSGVVFSHRDSNIELIQFGLQGSDSLTIRGSRLQLRGSGNVLEQPIVDHDTSVPFIYEAQFDKTTSSHFVRINGDLEQTSTYNFGSETFNSSIQLIGGFNSGSETANYDGLISEFILLTSTPTQEEQQKLEGYLAWKWGGI
jgi:hypothetical protein